MFIVKPVSAALAMAVFLTVSPRLVKANLITNGTMVSMYPKVQQLTVGNSVDKQKKGVTTTTGLPGWTVAGSVDVVTSKQWKTPAGQTSTVDLVGTNGIGSISQTVSGLTIGDTYTLTFDLAANPSKWHNENTLTKFMDVTVSNSDQTVPVDFSASVAAGATYKNMTYTTETVTFTALAADTTITLAGLLPETLTGKVTASNIRCGTVVSDIALVDSGSGGGGGRPIPEPATVGVLGLAAVGLLRRGKRRA